MKIQNLKLLKKHCTLRKLIHQLKNIIQLISSQLSVDQYIFITKRKQILPFYHTVSNHTQPHFSELTYYRTMNNFIDDLQFFTTYYHSVDVQNIGSNTKSFHLSFDDGMSQIYTEIFPLLKEKNIDATFFINQDFVDNKNMFSSHKRSLLIYEFKNSQRSREILTDYLDNDEKKCLKKIQETKDEKTLAEIAAKISFSFENYLNEVKPYVTLTQLQEIRKAGFSIANHGKSHINFSQLTFEEQKSEIFVVNEFLKANNLAEKFYFCFPYGGDKIDKNLFDWMYTEAGIEKSFGIAGLKNDYFAKHYHRILMERGDLTAEEIIKFEYLYYILKFFIGKNSIRR